MGEYLSPYISTKEGFNDMGSLFQKIVNGQTSSTTEGFTDLDKVFEDILKVGPAPVIPHLSCSSASGSGAAGCPPTTVTTTTTGTTVTTPAAPTAFLSTLLEQELTRVKSLMDTAKRISPVVQTLSPKPDAYDAAFENSNNPGLPRAGATLQGFTIILLIVSFIALTMVSVIAVNNITQNAYTAGKTFIGFIILGVILFSLIARLG